MTRVGSQRHKKKFLLIILLFVPCCCVYGHAYVSNHMRTKRDQYAAHNTLKSVPTLPRQQQTTIRYVHHSLFYRTDYIPAEYTLTTTTVILI